MADTPQPEAKTAKPVDEKTLQGLLGEQVRHDLKVDQAYAKAKEAAGTDDDKLNKAAEDYRTQLAEKQKEIDDRLKSPENKAAYEAFKDNNYESFKGAAEQADKVTKSWGAAADNSVKIAALAAVGGLAAHSLLPNKEVQKEDGSTERKSGIFKKVATVVLGAIAAAAILNKVGPTKGWVGKIAGERLAKAAAPAAHGIG